LYQAKPIEEKATKKEQIIAKNLLTLYTRTAKRTKLFTDAVNLLLK